MGNNKQVLRSEQKKHIILVVDDNADVTKLVSILLEQLGHEVHHAFDGESALEVFRAHEPTVVVLDIGLPDIDGYEVARAIRRQNRARAVTLIAMTGYGQRSDEIRAHKAGFDFHLTKPVSIETLTRIINLA